MGGSEEMLDESVRSKWWEKISSGFRNNYTDLVRIKAAGVDPEGKSDFKDRIIGLAFLAYELQIGLKLVYFILLFTSFKAYREFSDWYAFLIGSAVQPIFHRNETLLEQTFNHTLTCCQIWCYISLCWALPVLHLEIKHHENEQKPVKNMPLLSGWWIYCFLFCFFSSIFYSNYFSSQP